MDKKTYIIIIIGVLTILGTIFLNKILTKDSKNNNTNSTSIHLVENYSDFFTVNGCATKYINYLTSENKEALIKVLNESYVSQNKITKEEFYKEKQIPIYRVGQANQKGNTKFSIITEECILFKSNKESL